MVIGQICIQCFDPMLDSFYQTSVPELELFIQPSPFGLAMILHLR